MPITSRSKQTKPTQTAAGTFKVAGIQMASSPQVSSNLTETERLIAIAAQQGAKIVCAARVFLHHGLERHR